MNRMYLYGMGIAPAALLLAGSAFAAAPEGLSFNAWEATDGVIVLRPNGEGGSNCVPPACVVLLRENGMLQARVRANDDPDAQGYFQTITTEEGFTGAALDATFRNESFVEANNGSFAIAGLNFVEFDESDFMQARINTGSLRDAAGNETSLEIYQKNTLTGFGNVDFWFERLLLGGAAQFSTNTSAGASLRIDYTVGNITGNRGTPMTMRQMSGFYTQGDGTMELVDGQSIDYSAGDHIGVVFGAGLLWHGGDQHTGNVNANRHFEVQSISNYTTATSANWTNATNSSTVDDTGVGFLSFQAAWADAYTDNPNLWDDNFGTAPNADSVSGTFTNLQGNPFPDAPWAE